MSSPIDYFANYPNHGPNRKPPAPRPADPPKAAVNYTDPVAAAASSLLQLATLSGGADAALFQSALEGQAERIRQNNFSGVETMLAAQAQVLHMLFAQAVEKYAAAASEDHRGYGILALKAQSYCRMTIDAIARVKTNQSKLAEIGKIEEPAIKPALKSNKIEEPAIKEADDAAMDTGGTQTPGGVDSRLAAMADGHTKI